MQLRNKQDKNDQTNKGHHGQKVLPMDQMNLFFLLAFRQQHQKSNVNFGKTRNNEGLVKYRQVKMAVGVTLKFKLLQKITRYVYQNIENLEQHSLFKNNFISQWKT